MMKTTSLLLLAAATAALLSACKSPEARLRDLRAEGDRLEEQSKHKKLAYTFEDFIASEHYRETRDMWRGAAIEQYNPANSYAEILLAEQRGRLYINGQIAMDFPVCSGRFGGKETPKGTFRISQKLRDYRSNLYGSYVDANDNFVKGDAVAGKPGPAGTHFRGASMPYWMRFNGAIGMHVGNVHRDAASHGCVRVPEEACSILFSKLAVGSKVIVR